MNAGKRREAQIARAVSAALGVAPPDDRTVRRLLEELDRASLTVVSAEVGVDLAEELHAEGKLVSEVFTGYYRRVAELTALSGVAADLLAACESAVTAITEREEPSRRPAEREALTQGLRALTKARAHIARYHSLTDSMIRAGLQGDGS